VNVLYDLNKNDLNRNDLDNIKNLIKSMSLEEKKILNAFIQGVFFLEIIQEKKENKKQERK